MGIRNLVLIFSFFFLVTFSLGLPANGWAGWANSPNGNNQNSSVDLEFKEKVFKVLMENKGELLKVIQKASEENREKQLLRHVETAMEKENRINPKVDENKILYGKKDAPVTMVNYTNFMCPYCGQLKDVIEKLFSQYGYKLNLVMKILPHGGVDLKETKYFESLRILNDKAARVFVSFAFNNKNRIQKNPDKYLNGFVDKLDNRGIIEKDKFYDIVNSKQVMKIINENKKEAEELGINGTPVLVLNGVKIEGYQPISIYEKVIDELLGVVHKLKKDQQ